MNATFWKQVSADKEEATNDRALTRHMAHTERARAAAEIILAFIEDHGEVAPDDVDWGHVGTMANIANDLQDIAAQIRD